MSAPVLFDRRLAAIRLAAARHRQPASGPADFLLARALDDLDDRLAALTRRFAVGAALGDVTGLIKSRLKESGRIDRVVALSPVPGGNVDVVGDDERLPFAAASLDFATSLLTLQAVNDLPGAFVQVRRALRPDGLYPRRPRRWRHSHRTASGSAGGRGRGDRTALRHASRPSSMFAPSAV